LGSLSFRLFAKKIFSFSWDQIKFGLLLSLSSSIVHHHLFLNSSFTRWELFPFLIFTFNAFLLGSFPISSGSEWIFLFYLIMLKYDLILKSINPSHLLFEKTDLVSIVLLANSYYFSIFSIWKTLLFWLLFSVIVRRPIRKSEREAFFLLAREDTLSLDLLRSKPTGKQLILLTLNKGGILLF